MKWIKNILVMATAPIAANAAAQNADGSYRGGVVYMSAIGRGLAVARP